MKLDVKVFLKVYIDRRKIVKTVPSIVVFVHIYIEIEIYTNIMVEINTFHSVLILCIYNPL